MREQTVSEKEENFYLPVMRPTAGRSHSDPMDSFIHLDYSVNTNRNKAKFFSFRFIKFSFLEFVRIRKLPPE